MNRKEKVYNALRKLTQNILLKDLTENSDIGFDAETISAIAQVDRSNASRELNELAREGKAIKINGRPVKFLDRSHLEQIAKLDFENGYIFDTLNDFLKFFNTADTAEKEKIEKMSDPFDRIIGSRGSLALAIKQAKAAILYPPKGLHTLITGPTGVGKTTFAEMMYQYALYAGSIPNDAKLVIFNCSEYADNPQLILSQLFGHTKGAFTGAINEKAGLVEMSDRGILLLDEIHRLPPEAQEMLFLLMDKGIYRRLGETDKYRQATVLIIGATTENINSALLKTFLRRVPMTINLPSLEERPMEERMELIEEFFINEVNNVNVPVKVHKDVIRAFLQYNCTGNIGQLKGDIQLLCARGFLDYKTYGKKEIEININFLPEHVYTGLLNQEKSRNEIINLLRYEKDYYTFTPQDRENFLTVDNYDLSDNLYKEITDKYNHYFKIGYSGSSINEIISEDIEKYLKELMKKYNAEKELPVKEELFKIISPKVYNAAEMALTLAQQKLNRTFSTRAVIGLAMHISALIERISSGEIIYSEEINKIALNNPEEFRAAKLVREVLQQELEINIPKEEIGFLTMFLSTVDSDTSYKKIGVIVLAHGESTASSIANVANSLLGTDHCRAIDMPLDVKVEEILNKTIEKVKSIDEGKGVLLLVDMGSLIAFSEIITKKTNIPTKSIENISTPIVIEAVRKSLLPEMSLYTLVEDIKNANPYIGRMVSGEVINKADITEPKVILTTCISGKGAAVKIAQLLRNTLPFLDEYNVKIKPVDITEKVNQAGNKTLYEGTINDLIAVVGTVDLQLSGVPFIPIDELIIGDGIKKIEKSISGLNAGPYEKEEISGDSVFVKLLEGMLTFLDAKKAFKFVNDSYIMLVKMLGINDTRQLKTRYIFHNCCMIERLIQNDILPYSGIEKLIKEKRDIYEKVKYTLIDIEEAFGIKVPDTEIGYIMDIFDTQ